MGAVLRTEIFGRKWKLVGLLCLGSPLFDVIMDDDDDDGNSNGGDDSDRPTHSYQLTHTDTHTLSNDDFPYPPYP